MSSPLGTTTNDFATTRDLPVIAVAGEWQDLVSGGSTRQFEAVLPRILQSRRWFGGKARTIASAAILGTIQLQQEATSFLLPVRVAYQDGGSEVYLLSVSFAVVACNQAEALPGALARVRSRDQEGVLYDAMYDAGFCRNLLDMIGQERCYRGVDSEMCGVPTAAFHASFNALSESTSQPRVVQAEQSNTSVLFDDRLILKMFRRVESGVNPDFEIGRFLTEHGFTNSPRVAGAIELRAGGKNSIIAILQGFVRNHGDAWKYTLESVHRSFDRVVRGNAIDLIPDEPIVELIDVDMPKAMVEAGDGYLRSAELLGERTAQMHLVLASDESNGDFAPEPFSADYQQWIFESMSGLATNVLGLLRSCLHALNGQERSDAERLVAREGELRDEFHAITEFPVNAARIRIHGDYHLGQVLFTGDDFVIIDFEGEPLRPIPERRMKRSPMRDVAGMLRSFHYAAYTALFERQNSPGTRVEVLRELERFVRAWCVWTSVAFLKGYLNTADGAVFVPNNKLRLEAMLNAFQLEKAVYELGYEINNRPEWVRVPMQGISELLDHRSEERRRRLRVA